METRTKGAAAPSGAVETRDPASGESPAAMDRRAFVGVAFAQLGTLALLGRDGAAVPRAFAIGTGAHPVAPQPIGLQLYTVRDLMERDVERTLRSVAAIGYREVEFAGLFDRKPQKVRELLDKLGLTSPSSHIPIERLRASLQGVVDEAQALGNTYVVCPYLDAGARRDADAWHRIAAEFNRIGESLSRTGLEFAYHNHDFEFHPLPDGQIGYDILLRECDPKAVKLELDLFWITKGGRDPLAYFAKWPGRFPMVHVKDMAGNGVMTNVGQGHIDWGRIFAKRREAGIEHFFVEHDQPKDPLNDITASYRYLARLDL